MHWWVLLHSYINIAIIVHPRTKEGEPLGDNVGETVGPLGNEVKETVGSLGNEVKETVGSLGNKVKETVGSLGETVGSEALLRHAPE